MIHPRDLKGQEVSEITRLGVGEACEKDDMIKEMMDSVHPRDENLSGRIFRWSEKDARRVKRGATCIRGTRS